MKIEIIDIVQNIFSSKKWDLEEENQMSSFNLFCETLEFLKEEEQINLMLDLLKRFLLIDSTLYIKEIVKGFKLLIDSKSAKKTFFILPLISAEDIGKNKSCHHVLYLFKGTTIKNKLPILANINLSVIDKIEDLKKLEGFKIQDNQHLVLVDDFIGTGETAVSAVNHLLFELPLIKKENISVFSIVVQEHGRDTLKKDNIDVHFSNLVKRGISDEYDEDEKKQKMEIMDVIETKLKGLKPEYKYGYKQSEALVCMERTPNNTFPIFWYNKNKKYNPPFPR